MKLKCPIIFRIWCKSTIIDAVYAVYTRGKRAGFAKLTDREIELNSNNYIFKPFRN
jgi:hypothetical protein